MLRVLPGVLDAAALKRARDLLAGANPADWIDGRATAGNQSAAVKRNRQLHSASTAGQALRDLVLQGLQEHPGFFTAALPKKILPPRINRYGAEAGGEFYGDHIDGAVLHGGGLRVRADLSCTVFLADPDAYGGGDLVVTGADGGTRRVKLPAGDAVLYTGGQLHRVEPVTRGERLAAFFWVESLVRGEVERRLLLALDEQVQALRATLGECPQTVALAGTYHNLLRLWADT